MPAEIPKQDLESFVKRWNEFYEKNGKEFSTQGPLPRTEEEYRKFQICARIQEVGYNIILKEAKSLLEKYFDTYYVGHDQYWSQKEKGIVIYCHPEPISKIAVKKIRINFDPFEHITAEELFNRIWSTLTAHLNKQPQK